MLRAYPVLLCGPRGERQNLASLFVYCSSRFSLLLVNWSDSKSCKEAVGVKQGGDFSFFTWLTTPVHDVQRNIKSSHVEGNKVGQLHKQTMHGGVSEVCSMQGALGHFTFWSRSPTFRRHSPILRHSHTVIVVIGSFGKHSKLDFKCKNFGYLWV